MLTTIAINGRLWVLSDPHNTVEQKASRRRLNYDIRLILGSTLKIRVPHEHILKLAEHARKRMFRATTRGLRMTRHTYTALKTGKAKIRIRTGGRRYVLHVNIVSTLAPVVQRPPGIIIGAYGHEPELSALHCANPERMFDRIADCGASGVRIVLLDGVWCHREYMLFCGTDGNRGYDLTKLHPHMINRLSLLDRLARERGLSLTADTFDVVGLKRTDGRADRHPFNGANNIHGWPPIGEPFPDGPPDQRVDGVNKQEHTLGKWDYGPTSVDARDILRIYAANAIKLLPNATICTCNEWDTRTGEMNLVDYWRSIGVTNPLMLNGTWIWDEHLIAKEGPAMPAHIRSDVAHALPASAILRYHHASLEQTERMLTWLEPLASQKPNLKVMADTDGAGSGVVRGEGGRPSFEEIQRIEAHAAETFGSRYAGTVIKFLSTQDLNKGLEVQWR